MNRAALVALAEKWETRARESDLCAKETSDAFYIGSADARRECAKELRALLGQPDCPPHEDLVRENHTLRMVLSGLSPPLDISSVAALAESIARTRDALRQVRQSQHGGAVSKRRAKKTAPSRLLRVDKDTLGTLVYRRKLAALRREVKKLCAMVELGLSEVMEGEYAICGVCSGEVYVAGQGWSDGGSLPRTSQTRYFCACDPSESFVVAAARWKAGAR